MKTIKRLLAGLVFGLGMCICLANPSESWSEVYAILHNFMDGPTDGYRPKRGGPALYGSTLYGMTDGGGEFGCGTIYQINTDGSGYQILHHFRGLWEGPPLEGSAPYSSLTLSGSTLYGCTSGGGTYYPGEGTVFRINTDGSGFQVLHTFGEPGEINPYGAPIVSGARLYGMTEYSHFKDNPADRMGGIYAMNTDGSDYQVLHHFTGQPGDGEQPLGSLTLVGSRLYGMTCFGGQYDCGVIFSLNPDGSDYRVLHHFAGYPNDGARPHGALTLVGSRLYGMTFGGGVANGPGVIFSINLDGSGYRVILDFYTVGCNGPLGSLTLWRGKLYGMTQLGNGGAPGYGDGTIFRINPDGSGYQTLHTFRSAGGGGYSPEGDVTFAGSRLFGWTSGGGAYDHGVFFSLQALLAMAEPGVLELLLGQ